MTQKDISDALRIDFGTSQPFRIIVADEKLAFLVSVVRGKGENGQGGGKFKNGKIVRFPNKITQQFFLRDLNGVRYSVVVDINDVEYDDVRVLLLDRVELTGIGTCNLVSIEEIADA